MSNRFLGILIIIGFFGFGYIYYHLIYTPKNEKSISEQLKIKNTIVKEEQSPELVINKLDDLKLTNAQKIEDIKQKNKNYKTFKLFNNKKAYFRKNLNKLELFFGDKKIGNFDLVYKEYLRVDLVLGTKSDLYIEIGNNKFYYNSSSKKTYKIDINIPIIYVKLGIDNKLIIITEKGSFIYFIYNNSLEYFSYFKDFVYFENGYLGLIKKDESRILNNLGIKLNNNSLIFYYNPKTKEKKNIYITDLFIDKIYIENNVFYILTREGEIYELKNI